MDRDEMERDLTFQGLIIFRNELREDSAETITKLKVRSAIFVCGVSRAHFPQVLVKCVAVFI